LLATGAVLTNQNGCGHTGYKVRWTNLAGGIVTPPPNLIALSSEFKDSFLPFCDRCGVIFQEKGRKYKEFCNQMKFKNLQNMEHFGGDPRFIKNSYRFIRIF
jgi:hypothetical protein